MLHHIKKLFGIKPKEQAQAVVESTPYKVPEPAATIPLVPDDVTRAMLESIPTDKKPRKPRAPKTEKAIEAPAAKKPRAPRKPKAAKPD